MSKFSVISGSTISSYHDDMLSNDQWPCKSIIKNDNNSLWFWIETNHFFNCSLWEEEDQARRINVQDSEIVKNKRNIDFFNQKRNDAIEMIDELILSSYKRNKLIEPEFINSETLGSIIDRLSIASLKIHNMQIQASREDINIDMKESLSIKLNQLKQQRVDLVYCHDQIHKGLFDGSILYKTYKQYKMYNDKDTNPYLSGLK